MMVTGEIREAEWSVEVETVAAETDGYQCRVHVTHKSPEGMCEREFVDQRTFPNEREAALAGLRTGMTWIEMKKSSTFTV